jgi:hypothetical protein
MKFKVVVENQTDQRIKTLHIDNGTMGQNSSIKMEFDMKGLNLILHRVTALQSARTTLSWKRHNVFASSIPSLAPCGLRPLKQQRISLT